MSKVLRYTLLTIPLLWFLHVWLVFVFNIPFDLGIVYDSTSHPEDPPQTGFISDGFLLMVLFLGTPFSFITGTIYTFYRKYWWWLAAYLVGGGGLFVCLYYVRFFGSV